MTVCNLRLLNDSKTCLFCLSDSDGDGELPLNPDGRPFKNHVSMTLFLRRKSAFSWEEIAKIVIRKYDKEQVCLSQPIYVSFLLDHSKFQNKSDIMCDNIDVWKHMGSSTICSTLSNEISTFSNAIPIILVKEVCYRNTSGGDVLKIVSTVYGT